MGHSTSYIISLLKITDFPDDFLNGYLYCNRLNYHREAEEKERGDKNEGLAVSNQRFKPYTLKIYNTDLFYYPTFCMLYIYSNKRSFSNKVKLDNEKLKKFGSYTVIITDVKEFINRVERNIPNVHCEVVRYIDFNTLQGVDELAIYNPIATKDKNFSYQQEFRIYVHRFVDNDNFCPIRYTIGDLHDIGIQFPTSDLYRGVDVELNIDWDYCRKSRFQVKVPKLPISH